MDISSDKKTKSEILMQKFAELGKWPGILGALF